MINIMRDFYIVHYNICMVFGIMLALAIFFATKKNWKGIIILLVLMIAFNAAIFMRTNGKAWTRTFYTTDEYEEKYLFYGYLHNEDQREYMPVTDSVEFTFVPGNPDYAWVVYDESDDKRIYHWCWFDDMWEGFKNTSLVDKLWGTEQANAVRNSSEARVGDLDN